MFDFHIHSIFSDGELLPAELCQRYLSLGFEAIAITDHCDASNLEFVVESLVSFVEDLPKDFPLRVIPGVEVTHVPPNKIGKMVSLARTLGAKLVIVHGQTLTEPVADGTNHAAIEAGCDILAHPGFIGEEDARLARERGVFLEITTRRGHCYTNGWVLQVAQRTGAKLIVDNDAHTPEDILPYDQMLAVLKGAGASDEIIERVKYDSAQFLQSLISS